jgi:hypothetical protein
LYQPGLARERGTAAWYSTINKQDTALGTSWNAGEAQRGHSPDRFAVAGAVSYVTGTHNVKVGVQDTWGKYARWRNANGDLRAHFLNGRAYQAQILNSPVNFQDDLRADVGVYAQDSWTLARLTLNYGARWEYFASGIPAEASEAGRFALPREVAQIDMPTWKSLSPRFGVVYDVFGNQRTAVKFSLGKYMQQGTTGFAETYNPLALTSANVAWTDTNGDGVPQGERGCVYLAPDCEINLAQLPAGFGVATLSTFDPDIERMYNVERSVNVQQEASR